MNGHTSSGLSLQQWKELTKNVLHPSVWANPEPALLSKLRLVLAHAADGTMEARSAGGMIRVVSERIVCPRESSAYSRKQVPERDQFLDDKGKSTELS